MSEPWFDPNRWGWLPGTLLGVVAGTWGGVTGMLAPRGRARGLVLGGMVVMLAISGVLFVAGVVALVSGQPYGVWYGLGLAGAIGLVVIGVNFPTVRNVYRQAEERKIAAQDAPLGLTDGL